MCICVLYSLTSYVIFFIVFVIFILSETKTHPACFQKQCARASSAPSMRLRRDVTSVGVVRAFVAAATFRLSIRRTGCDSAWRPRTSTTPAHFIRRGRRGAGFGRGPDFRGWPAGRTANMEGLDLSHLTENERQQIMQVMARQKVEEDQERENFKSVSLSLSLFHFPFSVSFSFLLSPKHDFWRLLPIPLPYVCVRCTLSKILNFMCGTSFISYLLWRWVNVIRTLDPILFKYIVTMVLCNIWIILQKREHPFGLES